MSEFSPFVPGGWGEGEAVTIGDLNREISNLSLEIIINVSNLRSQVTQATRRMREGLSLQKACPQLFYELRYGIDRVVVHRLLFMVEYMSHEEVVAALTEVRDAGWHPEDPNRFAQTLNVSLQGNERTYLRPILATVLEAEILDSMPAIETQHDSKAEEQIHDLPQLE